MSAYTVICPECEKEFVSYDAAPRLRCSVACDIAASTVSVPRATLEQVREALRVATTPLPEDREQVRAALALLDGLLAH